MGRYYIIAFPMNEVENHPTQALEVYIGSNEDGIVTLKSKYKNLNYSFRIKANEITTISSEENDIVSWDREIRSSDSVSSKAIEIESTVPISVYVMNSKIVSTEGYRAIPVKNWGLEYRHCSYYDFSEFKNWGSGFLAIAAQDSTVIEVTLQGTGSDDQIQGSNKEFNKTYSVILNKGETYMIKGKGETRGIFDLSGSLIKSNLPIGLISFHQRTIIPVKTTENGRDHLAEMLKPITSWGKKYYTVELDRGTDMGDFFRIMAADDDTKVSAKWYDKYTGEYIYGFDQKIHYGGNFIEAQQHATTPCYDDGGNIASIRGFAVIEADKPIQVLQYSYSSCWDNAEGAFDPFMIDLAPIEQHTEKLHFMTPSNYSNNDFNKNYLNLVIKGDAKDQMKNFELLSSVELDGTPIVEIDPKIFDHVILDSLYWATIPLEQGSHSLIADTKINGFTYGFGFVDSYGWPLGNAGYDMSFEDSSAPIISENEVSNGKYEVNFKESSSDYESNIYREPIIIESDNFSMYHNQEIDQENWYLNPEGVKELNYILNVDDLNKDAFIEFAITDDRGNVSTKEITYKGTLSVDNNVIISGNELSVYPNPVKNKLNFKSTENLNIKNVKILDLNGLILSETAGLSIPSSLNVSDLVNGIYFVEFEYESQTYQMKFVKN
jgi:hypothetical protein